jgi:hypothetical protein
MTKLKKRLAIAAAAAVIGIGAAGCGSATDAGTSTDANTSAGSATAATAQDSSQTAQAPASGGNGSGGEVSADAVGTEDEFVNLIQQAYGDPALGLHRGHRPVESTLIDVLGITHEEMHVRMESEGQNLAAVATDLGIDPQTLIDALVDSWSPAIDNLLEAGTITQEQADAYQDELEQAFAFRVTWNGEDATPTAEAVS